MFCIPSLVVVSCLIKMSFVEYYRQACYNAPRGHYWAGATGETNEAVTKRVLDATALYQDYLEARREACGSMWPGSVPPPLSPR